jgi:hypothetical protein
MGQDPAIGQLKAADPILQGMLRGVGATVPHSSRILIMEKCHPHSVRALNSLRVSPARAL